MFDEQLDKLEEIISRLEKEIEEHIKGNEDNKKELK